MEGDAAYERQHCNLSDLGPGFHAGRDFIAEATVNITQQAETAYEIDTITKVKHLI